MHRLGFGAMRLTGEGIWGAPKNRSEAIAVLRRAMELDQHYRCSQGAHYIDCRSDPPKMTLLVER